MSYDWEEHTDAHGPIPSISAPLYYFDTENHNEKN